MTLLSTTCGFRVGGLTRFEIHFTRNADFGGAGLVKGPWIQGTMVLGVGLSRRQTCLREQPEGI